MDPSANIQRCDGDVAPSVAWPMFHGWPKYMARSAMIGTATAPPLATDRTSMPKAPVIGGATVNRRRGSTVYVKGCVSPVSCR